LYKADVFGALVSTEHVEITCLVQQFIQILEEAAISDCHIASRFASLLKCMWLSDRQCFSPRTAPSDALNNINRLRQPTQHFELPRNIDLVDDRNCRVAAFETQLPEPFYIPTPDFNLFCPEFSSLESDLVELGVGSLGYPV
jgi:hypothetical protein